MGKSCSVVPAATEVVTRPVLSVVRTAVHSVERVTKANVSSTNAAEVLLGEGFEALVAIAPLAFRLVPCSVSDRMIGDACAKEAAKRRVPMQAREDINLEMLISNPFDK